MIDSLHVCISCKKPISFAVTYCPICGHRQKSGTAPLWLGERRLVTILFADLSSFTAASEDTDPEDVIEMLNRVFTRLMAECDRQGGYLDKTVGDQLMVLFGAPRTHEDDAVRAVRAALAMQDAMEELAPVMLERVGAACKLNIGIHMGVVVWGRVGPHGRAAPTVIGDAVNLASRLEQFATAGQIVVSDAVYFHTRRFFEYEILEPIRVKGKSKLIPIYTPLHQHQSVRSRKQASEITIPLIEREQELQYLDANWARALDGQARFVLLSGDAGLGKSRTLSEFISGLKTYSIGKQQPLLLQTYAESTSIGNYSPLSDLVAQLFNLTANDTELSRRRKVEDRAQILGITGREFLPLIGYLLGWYNGNDRLASSEQDLEYLRESAVDAAVTLFLNQAKRRPILVIIDDLQWAESSTIQWFNRMAFKMQTMQSEQSVSRPTKLMVLVASRPVMGASPKSLHVVDDVISLPPLSNAARRDLILQLLPGRELPISLIERFSHDSGGNPFYLEEATRGLVQSGQLVRNNGAWELTRPIDQIYVPQSVEGLVMAHLDALDPVARMVLQYASVIGFHFGHGLLTAITPVNDIDTSLNNLEQRGLIKEVSNDDVGQSFSFTQMVVREVAYRSLLRKTRRELHDDIARLTEAMPPVQAKDDMEALAARDTARSNGEKRVSHSWLAGQRALDLHDFELAFRHLEQAWSALREIGNPDPDVYRNIANSLGDASTFTGNFSQAEACYQVIQKLMGDTPGEAALYHYKIGRLHAYKGSDKVAKTYYQQALELASDSPMLLAQIDAEIRLVCDLG